MAGAGDKRQLDAIKAMLRRWGADPVQLRFVVALGLFGLGVFGIERPLASRVANALTANTVAKSQARMAEELRSLSEQSKEYTPRVAVSADLVDWQNYVLDKLRCTTATLISLEPKAPVQKQPFTVLQMELVARGTSFSEFTDFASRLEHGERLVRFEKVRIERQQTSMYLTMLIRGLVRGAPAEKDAKSVKAGKDKPEAGGKTDAAAVPETDADAGDASADPAAAETPDADAASSEPDAAPDASDAPAEDGRG